MPNLAPWPPAPPTPIELASRIFIMTLAPFLALVLAWTVA